MKRINVFMCASVILFSLAMFAHSALAINIGGNQGAQGTIDLNINKTSFKTGEVIQLDASIYGSGTVDLYLIADIPTTEDTDPSLKQIDNKPLPLQMGREINNDTYSLPIPVVPILPEGDYTLTLFMVDERSAPVKVNWIDDASVQFTIQQLIEPLVEINGHEVVIPLENGGELRLNIEDGEITGTITVVTEDGNSITRTVTGTYEVDLRNKEIRIYLEGESDIGAEIVISANNGILSVKVNTSRGNSADLSYNTETQEVSYSVNTRDIQAIMEALDVSWEINDGALFVTVSIQNQDNSTSEVTFKGTWETQDKSLILHIENIDDSGQSLDVTLTPNRDGTITMSWETGNGNSGTKTFETRLTPENYDPESNTWSREIRNRGSFSATMEGDNTMTLTFTMCDRTGELCVDKSATITYGHDENSAHGSVTTEGGREVNGTMTNEDGNMTIEIDAGDGNYTESFDVPDFDGSNIPSGENLPNGMNR